MPLHSWCERTWLNYTSQQMTPLPLLLPSIIEPLIWENIIASAKETHQLLQVADTADIARTAWSLLQQWQINIEDPLFRVTDDSLALYHWIQDFLATCQKYH